MMLNMLNIVESSMTLRQGTEMEKGQNTSNKSDPLDPSCCFSIQDEATRSLNALPSRRNRACSSESFQIKISNSRNTCPTCCSWVAVLSVSLELSCSMCGLKGLLHIHTSLKKRNSVCQVPGFPKHPQIDYFQVLVKSYLIMELSMMPSPMMPNRSLCISGSFFNKTPEVFLRSGALREAWGWPFFLAPR